MSLSTDDLVQIQHLYAVYNTAIDTGDGKTFANCFTENGVLDSGMAELEGHEAVAGFAVQTNTGMPKMRHNATNVVAEGEGNRAQGSAFLIGYLAAPEYKVIVTGRYTDELEKTEAGWRFTKRVFRADS